MKRKDLIASITAVLLPLIFISIFKYRIVGSNPGMVVVGGIGSSVGVVFVVHRFLSRIFASDPETDTVSITVGSVLVSAVVYGIQFGLSGTAYGDWLPVLAVIATTAGVTFLVGNNIGGKPSEGLRHGFLTGGVSGILCVVLVTYEATTREVIFNALVAISSVTIPLFFGVVGTIFALFGNSFARRRRAVRMPILE